MIPFPLERYKHSRRRIDRCLCSVGDMETVWAIKAHAKLRISYFRFRNETLKARRVEIAAILTQSDFVKNHFRCEDII